MFDSVPVFVCFYSKVTSSWLHFGFEKIISSNCSHYIKIHHADDDDDGYTYFKYQLHSDFLLNI